MSVTMDRAYRETWGDDYVFVLDGVGYRGRNSAMEYLIRRAGFAADEASDYLDELLREMLLREHDGRMAAAFARSGRQA